MTARVRKAPSGRKHISCLRHVPHAYPSTGYVCVTTDVINAAWPLSRVAGADTLAPGAYGPVVPRSFVPVDRAADMVAFADHLASVAADHAARELARRAVPAEQWDTDNDGRPFQSLGTDPDGRETIRRPANAAAYSGTRHLPWDTADDRASRARLAETFIASRAARRNGAPAPAREPIAPIVYPAPAEGSAESLAAAFRGFASDMLTAGRELGILAPAEPIYAEPAPIVAPEPAAETAEDVAEPAADPGADTAEPYDSDASTREWWRGREHRGRAVDGTAQWADGADDVYGAGTYGVAQCDACGDPIASTPAYDAWSHAADDVAEAMRQLGMMGADTADTPAETPETAEDGAEPDGAPIVAPVGDAPAYGTQHVGVRHNGRADWRTYDRETGADIGPMHATRTAAVAYAQERQLTTYGPAPEPIADTPEPMTLAETPEGIPVYVTPEPAPEPVAETADYPLARSVYRVTARDSHATDTLAYDATYSDRAAALAWREDAPYPIVDVVAVPWRELAADPEIATPDRLAEPSMTHRDYHAARHAILYPAPEPAPIARGRGRRQCPVHGRAGLVACDMCGDPWEAPAAEPTAAEDDRAARLAELETARDYSAIVAPAEDVADTPEPVAEPVRHLQYADRSGFTYCAQVPTARDISAPDHLGALSVLTAVGGFCEMCIEYCARALAPEPGADPDGAERCAYDGCATPDSLDTHHGGNGGPAHMRVTAAELASWAAEDVAEPAEPIAEPVADPAPVAPILAAVPAPAEPAPVAVDGRPSCPRCGQTFRKGGTGRDWHVANRPDCAGDRPAVLSVAS